MESTLVHCQMPDLRADCTLSNQIWRFRDLECQLPQDKVFGLLGMCVDVNVLNPIFQPDYTVPPSIIFGRAAHYIISTTRKLSLLGFTQSYRRTINSPSGAPDWTISKWNRRTAVFANVGNAKSDVDRYLYAATSESKIDVPIFRNLNTLAVCWTIVARLAIVGSSNLLSGQVTVSVFPGLFLQWWKVVQ